MLSARRLGLVTLGAAGSQGNDARYINHSCDPNAYTKVVVVDGVKRVAIIALRAIPAGAEVFYDYKARRLGVSCRRHAVHTPCCRQPCRHDRPARDAAHDSGGLSSISTRSTWS